MVPADETKEQRDRREFERFKRFSEDLNALVHGVDSQSPFVPVEIYQPLEDAIQTARGESLDIQDEWRDRGKDWYERGRKNYREFTATTAKVSDLIRIRLAQLTVVQADH